MTTKIASDQIDTIGTASGVVGDGVADNTSALLDSAFTQNSIVRLGDGTFLMAKWMEDINLQGNGSSTRVKALDNTTNDGFALSLGGHTLPHGNWDKHYLRDMAVEKDRATVGGGCIRFDDEDVADGADLASGAWVLENLSLEAFDGICVKAEFGSIGNVYNNVAYHNSLYGHWAQNNQFSIQHTGAQTWNDCHWQRVNEAAVYLNDSQDGRGAWTFNQSIMEQNYGFGIFAKSTSGGVPTCPLTLNQHWFEKNGTEATPAGPATVTIDSIVYTPKDMRFEKFGGVVINGTHVKSMDVVDSDVACYDSRHDGDGGYYSVTKDDDATITISNPSGGSSFGTVDEWSHTAPARVPSFVSNRPPSLRMAHRSVHAAETASTVKAIGFDKPSGTLNMTGSGAVASVQVMDDGLTLGSCSEYTVPASYTVFRSDGAALNTGKWIVASIAMKVVSGLANISAARIWDVSSNISTNIRVGAVGEWVTTVSLIDMRTATTVPNVYPSILTTSGGQAVVRLADYQVVEFDTKQEAADYIHAGIFEYDGDVTLSPTADTVNDTAACSLTTEQSNLVTTGAAAPTLADGVEGQVKTIYHKTYAGAATITPANMHGGTSVATSAAGQGVTFKFTDSKWLLLSNPYGLTIV
jgi:hypothetical protein